MAPTWKRWTPAVIAVVAVAAAAVGVPLAASASSPLAPKTAKQLIAMIAASKVTSLSGTIEQTSDLGLPSIPSTGSSSSSSTSAGSIMELLTGTHTAKIYLDGATKQRVQVLDSSAERDIYRNGSTVWVYDSKKHTAVETTLPSRMHRLPAGTRPSTRLGVFSPKDAATGLLAALKSDSTLSVGGNLGVAGRSAYDLVLKPNDSDTLLGSVSIAVDSQTGLPLRVDVNARGASAPAIRIGFTQLSLSKPSTSVFAFTPPSDAKVTKTDAMRHGAGKPQHLGGKPSGAKGPAKPGTKPTTTVTGSGWDAVVTITAKDSKKLSGSLTSNPLYSQLSTPVSGGRAFSTTLFTVLIMDDGRVLVGSVPLARLQTVASAS